MNKIKCNLCGLIKQNDGPAMGCIGSKPFYGNHTDCPSGDIGTFFLETPTIYKKKRKKYVNSI